MTTKLRRKKTIPLGLYVDQIEKLDELRKKNKLTRADLVRQLLDESLEVSDGNGKKN